MGTTRVGKGRATKRRPVKSLAMGLLAVSMLAACQSGSDTKADPKAPVTIWAGPDVLAVVKQYQKANPTVKVKVETVARADFPSKVLLANNTGKGWPDLIFLEMPLISQVADKAHDYPADISKYLPAGLEKEFTPGAFDSCRVDGKLICLRNDLAPNVLWYNTKLLDEFGYEVPTTFEEYQDLSDKVAKDHPGYLMGLLDGGLASYYQASGCPVAEPGSGDSLKIDLEDASCTRATELIDHMLENKTLSPLSVSGTELAKKVSDDKLLMLTGPAWFGQYLFGGTPESTWYKSADGQLAAASPLAWQGEEAKAGSNGGGAWVVSRHAKNPKTAAEIAVWMATSAEHAATAPSLPAHVPSAKIWQKTLDANKIYAQNPYPVFEDAAGRISKSLSPVRFDPITLFSTTVLTDAQQGKTVGSAIKKFQQQLVDTARTSKYNVESR